MQCGHHTLSPDRLYREYLRDLVLVARCGDREARQVFLATYRPQLEDLSPLLGRLPDWQVELALYDAVRTLESSIGSARSLLSFRLAVPGWFRARVDDFCGIHQTATDHYLPGRLVVDPVCGMLVDPELCRYHLDAPEGIRYFCCARCLAVFADDPGGGSLAA